MANKPSTISAFKSAIETQTVTAEICVEDVLTVKPNWTQAQAVEFLNKFGEIIGKEMAGAGAAALVGLLGGGRRGN